MASLFRLGSAGWSERVDRLTNNLEATMARGAAGLGRFKGGVVGKKDLKTKETNQPSDENRYLEMSNKIQMKYRLLKKTKS